jgi:hypothetical protein
MEETMNEEWKRLLAEKERQDRQLAQIEEQLRALGNVGLIVPKEYFEEMEALSVSRRAAAAPSTSLGLRA